MNGKFTIGVSGYDLVITDPSGNELDLEDLERVVNKFYLENKKLKKELEDWKEECLYLEANK